jgi:cell fate regulator YaaT (PSP1 superfamily)
MPDIVGVRFKRAGKVYYFGPAGVNLKVYDYVVVQTAKGIELGQVTIAPKQVLASELTAELKPIVRRASEDDIKRAQDFATKEDNAMAECSKLITRLKLPMKLVSAEYNLDGSRLTFYFTAEERVDFRELVRELTGVFKTRIELRQIGPRDQAKLVGGLGRCGRGLCCGSFLTEFSPVSIKMAKEQDLPLDPMKISGVCGRLQCCLSYESAQYREAKASMPRKGQRVESPSGNGTVIGVSPLKDTVLVQLESGADAEFPVSQVKVIEEGFRPPSTEARPPENEGPVAAAQSPKPQPQAPLKAESAPGPAVQNATKAESTPSANPVAPLPTQNEHPPVSQELQKETAVPKKEAPES